MSWAAAGRGDVSGVEDVDDGVGGTGREGRVEGEARRRAERSQRRRREGERGGESVTGRGLVSGGEAARRDESGLGRILGRREG